MKKLATIFLVLSILSTLALLGWGTTRAVKAIKFDIDCTQHLKRAADASTVDLAKEELLKAISYAEEHGLTEGVVSIFFQQPCNDVGFWYNNIKEAYAELDGLPEDVSSLEASNVLMRVRESIADQAKSGIRVTLPDGIEIYPNNIPYFWWGTVSFLLSIVGWIGCLYYWSEY